jgi:peroxiredoxin
MILKNKKINIILILLIYTFYVKAFTINCSGGRDGLSGEKEWFKKKAKSLDGYSVGPKWSYKYFKDNSGSPELMVQVLSNSGIKLYGAESCFNKVLDSCIGTKASCFNDDIAYSFYVY